MAHVRSLTLIELMLSLIIAGLLAVSALLSLSGSSDEAGRAFVQDLQARLQAELDVAWARAVQQSARLELDWSAPALHRRAVPASVPARGAVKQANLGAGTVDWRLARAAYEGCQRLAPGYKQHGLAAILTERGLTAATLDQGSEVFDDPAEVCVVLFDAIGQGLPGIEEAFSELRPVRSVPLGSPPTLGSDQLVLRLRLVGEDLRLEPVSFGSGPLRRLLAEAVQEHSALRYALTMQHFRALGGSVPSFRQADFDVGSHDLGRGNFLDYVDSYRFWQQHPPMLSAKDGYALLLSAEGDPRVAALRADLGIPPGEKPIFAASAAGLSERRAETVDERGHLVHAVETLDDQGNVLHRRTITDVGLYSIVDEEAWAWDLLGSGRSWRTEEQRRVYDKAGREIGRMGSSIDPFTGSWRADYRHRNGFDAGGALSEWNREYVSSHGTYVRQGTSVAGTWTERRVLAAPDGTILVQGWERTGPGVAREEMIFFDREGVPMFPPENLLQWSQAWEAEEDAPTSQ